MNPELIIQNSALYQEQIKADNVSQARETALMIARLLVSQANEGVDVKSMEEKELLSLMISYIGTANELYGFFLQIRPDFDLLNLPNRLKERIQSVNADLAKTTQEFRQEKELHRELLSQETELTEARERLLVQSKKVRELQDIRDRELKELQKEIQESEDKIKQLEQECNECNEWISLYHAEFSENNSLIANLPDATGMECVDLLIKEAKKYQKELDTERKASGERIDQIICAIEKFKEQVKGKDVT